MTGDIYERRASAIDNNKISDLLLWFSRVESTPETSTVDLSSLSGKEWCSFLQQVSYYRLFPVVMSKLNEHSTLELPQSVVEALEEKLSEHKKKLLRLNFELIKIATVLESEKIEAIFYKGPALSLLAYNSLEGRMFSDLDLWVKKNDYLEPKAILSSHGYLSLEYPTLSIEKEQEFRYYAGEYALVKLDSNICVDVHWQVLGGGFLGSIKTLDNARDRCIQLQVCGRSIKTLCPEDLLIYLCLNGLKDGWDSLRNVCDIDRLIRNTSSMNWDFILDESKALKITRAVKVGLCMSKNLLHTPLSQSVNLFVEEDSRVESIAKSFGTLMFCRGTFSSSSDSIRAFWLILMTLDSFSERKEYLKGVVVRFWRLLVTVNSKDFQVVKLPKLLFSLYYLIRIFRVVLLYRASVLKTMLK